MNLKSEVEKLLDKNIQLNQLNMAKVLSHVQREHGDWLLNTIMLEGYDVPFRYRRKKTYQSLKGARVNLTYYPQVEKIGGLDIEVMKIVRIRRA
jgi:hypothetical protein